MFGRKKQKFYFFNHKTWSQLENCLNQTLALRLTLGENQTDFKPEASQTQYISSTFILPLADDIFVPIHAEI